MLSRRHFVSIAGASLLAGPASAQSLGKIRVAMTKVTSMTPVFIARQRGYFREAGLEVEPVLLDLNQDAFRALTAQSADISIGFMTIFVLNIVVKNGLKIIGGQTREMRGAREHAVVVTDAAWKSGLQSLKDLKGHRVGIVPGTRYVLGQISAKYGFSLDSVKVVPLELTANPATVFVDNRLDAMVAKAPVMTGGRILAWTGDEVPWQNGAIATTPAMIHNRHLAVEHFLSAYTRGVIDYMGAFCQTDANGNQVKGPDADEFADLMANAFRVKKSDLGNDWPRIDPDAWLDGSEVNKQIAFWRSQGRIGKDFDTETILDRSFGKIV